MRLLYLIVIISLLLGAAAGQLSPDRERFDVELHPGEVAHKVLTLTNVGDEPIFELTNTPVGGDARDLIILDLPRIKGIDPEDDVEVDIFFVVPPETRPGVYQGFFYLFDDAPPSMPMVIDFQIKVVEQESYGVSLTINDAQSASGEGDPESPAEFDLLVRNTGRFKDVIVVDIPDAPQGWAPILLDGDRIVGPPYEMALPSGSSKELVLDVEFEENSQSGGLEIMAVSLGNSSANASVKADVEVGMAVRGYNVRAGVPQNMVVNRTYTGNFLIILEKDEKVNLEIITGPELLVVPSSQMVPVTRRGGGEANFTLLATKPGKHLMVFAMVDSMGVPIPEELAFVEAEEPNGTVILTADALQYTTIAALTSHHNQTIPVITVSVDRLSKEERERLYPYQEVVILGNRSVIGDQAEKELAEFTNTTRIAGQDMCETSWLLASKMWPEGTEEIVVCGPKDVDVLQGYQLAKEKELPLVICPAGLSDLARSVLDDLLSREKPLSRALLVGVPDDGVKALQDAGLETEVA
ncbi:MAG: hypothetical protein GKC10_01135 [Methanosarcinales archaeon]|nr:hypothetical protein [Methanosarcinales archaeon]